jgi:hypothetical protein
MVETVEDWNVLEAYAGFKQGFYQIIEEQNITDVRVNVGRLGFIKKFENKDDPLLKDILKFCKIKKYIQISNNIMDDFFFKHIPEEENKKTEDK